MATYSKHILTSTTGGESQALSTGSAPGDLLHTVPGGVMDEVWLWITCNGVQRNVQLRVGTGAPALILQVPSIGAAIDSGGGTGAPLLVCAGLILTAGQTVSMWTSGTASQIVVVGYVNRITP